MKTTLLPVTSIADGVGQEIAPDVFGFCVQIVNICFVGTPGLAYDWILVDAGMPGSSEAIISAAQARFGTGCRPKAMLLTHGHFDHVGAAVALAEYWDIPVYAHEREFPFLTGKASYPEPDPSVEGGMIAKLSMLFPNEPVDLNNRIRKLPADGSIPDLPGWQWLSTPGHSPGHVSFFRRQDRILIAGDAFVTVRQDALYKVFTQELEISGPPRYYTTDWQAAWDSVNRIRALQPSAAITGHGLPVSGEVLSTGLKKLSEEFDRLAIPDYGRYVASANLEE